MTLGAAILASLLVASPPSGRPPIGPLERYEPRMYDFTFEVAVSTVHQRNALDRQSYHLVDAPIVMPIIFQGTYSRVEHDSLAGEDCRANCHGCLLRSWNGGAGVHSIGCPGGGTKCRDAPVARFPRYRTRTVVAPPP